jgi:hypothetical protein
MEAIMDRMNFLTGIALLGCSVIISGCSSELLCDPVVVVSNTDYVGNEYDLPYEDIHAEFAENYAGKDLCVDLRNDLLAVMERKADSLGEDPDIFHECIKATYEDWDARPNRIPCYAEKCLYNSQSVWAIAFNRANNFEEETLGHFDLFYMSCSNYDVLYYGGCF